MMEVPRTNKRMELVQGFQNLFIEIYMIRIEELADSIKNGEAFTSTDTYSVLVITHPSFHIGKEHPEREQEHLSFIINELGLPNYQDNVNSQGLQEGVWFTAFHTLISPTSTIRVE